MRVVVTVMSLLANPVTLLEKVIGTVKVFAVCVPAGSLKLTVGGVVSKLIALDIALLAGAVCVPSVTAFFAISSVTLPFINPTDGPGPTTILMLAV